MFFPSFSPFILRGTHGFSVALASALALRIYLNYKLGLNTWSIVETSEMSQMTEEGGGENEPSPLCYFRERSRATFTSRVSTPLLSWERSSGPRAATTVTSGWPKNLGLELWRIFRRRRSTVIWTWDTGLGSLSIQCCCCCQGGSDSVKSCLHETSGPSSSVLQRGIDQVCPEWFPGI